MVTSYNNPSFAFVLQLFPIRLTPHSRVAHGYLGTPSLPNENLKFLKTALQMPSG